MRWAGAGIGSCVLIAGTLMLAPAHAAVLHRPGPRTRPDSKPHTHAPSGQAPTGPPLVSGAAAYSEANAPDDVQQGAGESEPESAAASEDPLVRNGLGSPLCRLAGGELSASAESDCRTSGFVAAAAPSEDYSFDTNIDTTLGISIDALLQDYIVRPVWMGLVWLVDALLVGLEWSYSLNLLQGPLASGLTPALDAAQREITQPWLGAALACAAMLAAYQGIVRRRVAETLGEALLMLAMIAAAMFVIADPSGTVGVLSQWAEEASAGSFDAVQGGSSAHPYEALAVSLGQLYAATIEAPWCFLEFGDVGWCDQPARLDPRLEKAAQGSASQIEAQAQRQGAKAGVGTEVLWHRAHLLRAARTNGQIFLALPANGPLRNSVKEHNSLFFVLCGGGSDATRCRGSTASEAEFRANSGTLPRLAGVVVIALGVLGMLLLFGFIVMRLLEAAIVSLLYLLLAPAVALAPAMGEAGRAAFRVWAGRLLSALTAKVLWSILLAALLSTMRIILKLQGLGWLVQWMLTGTLWWGLFLRRQHLLASTGRGGSRARPPRLGRTLGWAGGQVWTRAERHWREKRAGERRKQEEMSQGADESDSTEREDLAWQTAARQTLAVTKASANSQHGAQASAQLADQSARHVVDHDGQMPAQERDGLEDRLARLGRARAEAAAKDDPRRVASLDLRRQRVEAQLAAGDDSRRPPDRSRDSDARPSMGSARQVPARRSRKGEQRPGGASQPLTATARGPATARVPEARSRSDVERTTRHATWTSVASTDSSVGSQQDRLAAAEEAQRRGGRARPAAEDDPRSPGARNSRPAIDQEIGARKEAQPPAQMDPSERVMRDAIEVAQGRRRHLGWSWRGED